MGSGLQVQPGSGGAALGLGPSLESSLPQPLYTRGSGQVSTDCTIVKLEKLAISGGSSANRFPALYSVLQCEFYLLLF